MTGAGGETLPLFPLRSVLFPDGSLPLRIFEPRYVRLVSDCMREGRGFGVTPIRHGSEAGAPAEPHALGTCAEIVDFDQGSDGLLHILAKGSYRFRVLSHSVARDGLVIGEIARIVDEPVPMLPMEFGQLKTVLQKVLEIEVAAGGRSTAAPSTASSTVYRLLERLPFPLEVKLDILASTRADEQINLCSRALTLLISARDA